MSRRFILSEPVYFKGYNILDPFLFVGRFPSLPLCPFFKEITQIDLNETLKKNSSHFRKIMKDFKMFILKIQLYKIGSEKSFNVANRGVNVFTSPSMMIKCVTALTLEFSLSGNREAEAILWKAL